MGTWEDHLYCGIPCSYQEGWVQVRPAEQAGKGVVSTFMCLSIYVHKKHICYIWISLKLSCLERTPWTVDPCELRSMGSQRVGHDWVTNTLTFKLSFGRISVKLVIISCFRYKWLVIQVRHNIQIFGWKQWVWLLTIKGHLRKGVSRTQQRKEGRYYVFHIFKYPLNFQIMYMHYSFYNKL